MLRPRIAPFLLVYALLCTGLATPSWAGQITVPLSPLWYTDAATPPAVSKADSREVSERLTLDEAVALALDANRLTKNPGRLWLVTESVIQTYAGALRAQRTLEVREDAVKTCRELDRLVADDAKRGGVAPSVVLHARAALA
ncbi:MAG: hypothetical protein ACREKS_15470, partial [Candidatus Rokuibacteriota bacterium]